MATIPVLLQSCYHNRAITMDVAVEGTFKLQPLVIFCHGMNAFKDWGPWPLVAQAFTQAGFAFARFSFSHGGTRPDAPQEFVDLEGYTRNTHSIELSDLETVLAFFTRGKAASEGIFINTQKIYLMGHSRGGGLAAIKTAEEPTLIKGLVTLAALAGFGRRWSPEVLAAWQATGYRETINKRTGQAMRQGYSLVTDYKANENRLDVLQAAARLTCPWLIVHGTADETVPLADGLELALASPHAKTLWVPDGSHTLGGTHPTNGTMPEPLGQVVKSAIHFLQRA